MTQPQLSLAALGAGLLCLQACQSAQPDTKATYAAKPAVIPMDVEEKWDSGFEYLLSRYDADGDERIVRAEYHRSDTGWERLDRNKDGAITDADFRSRGGSMEDRMRNTRARRMVGRYFQADVDLDVLTQKELETAFAAYDTDGDSVVTEAEFTCACDDREAILQDDDSRMVQRYMKDAEPWATIVAGADTDDDGSLQSAELVAFFDRNQREGKISFGSSGRPSSRPTSPSARSEHPEGAPEGELAPDFTLSSPDGSNTVTLSSFRGEKPVALIFGSYT